MHWRKMESGDWSSAPVCSLCGDNYTLPEDDVEGNLPRVLLCGHICCSSCLRSLEQNNAITCPECEVEFTLPEGGVDGLSEDCRIIGLLYTAKMNKKRHNGNPRPRTNRNLPESIGQSSDDDCNSAADQKKFEQEVDEALVRAAESLAQLENTCQTLETGLAKQVTRERCRLQFEIIKVTNKAFHFIQKWKEKQLAKLSTLETHFVKTKSQLQQVEERVGSLQLAMQKAREVRRVPFLEKYSPLDKVLDTLQAPVENLFDVVCVSEVSGLRCSLNTQTVDQSLMLLLDFSNQSMENGNSSSPRHQDQQAEGKSMRASWPKSQLGSSPGSRSPSSSGSTGPCHDSPTDLAPGGATDGAPDDSSDIIIEEIMEDELQHVPPPHSSPQSGNEKSKSRRKKSSSTRYTQSVTQWVVVTHALNPSHFYVQYVAEKREGSVLSRKIEHFCSKSSSNLCTGHTLDVGSLIFVKYDDGLWHRTRVVEVSQAGYPRAVKSCPVTQISSIQVFFIDSGLTTSITIKSDDRESNALLQAVNKYLRRVSGEAKAELDAFAPHAVRCSLKDLVPYDQTKGWSKEAQKEFREMVDSTAVKMQILGQDKDFLLVDLKKIPVNRASGPCISVREHLVFIEVARFYYPVAAGLKPLCYYPPVPPKIFVEQNAVVSHINTPGDFYIQLVDKESLLLSDKMQKYYNSPLESEEKDLHICCPVIGEACVALFEDQKWYRAQVTAHPGARKVEVLYVDFGNKEILHITDIRKIKDEFFALPALAIHCCLSDVVPLDGRNWSEACCSLFISLADHKLVTIVATGKRRGPVPVKLFESGLNGPLDNIGEKLVTQKLALFRDRSSSRRQSCDANAIWDPPLDLGDLRAAGDELNTTELQTQLKLPTVVKDVKVRVSHVNSPSSFYVQIIKYDPWLKRVCELLKEACSHREAEDVQWKAGMYCAAHITGVWERAQLCSDVLSNNIAEVIRCDHGNRAKLHSSRLQPLPPELEGALALECTLCDIRPAGGRSTWTATACDFITFYLSGASAMLSAKEVSEERPVAVTLSCISSSGQLVSIADCLVNEGLALRDRKPQSVVASPDSEDTKEAEAALSKTEPPGTDGEGDNFTCSTSTDPIPLISDCAPCTSTAENTLGACSTPSAPSTPFTPSSVCTPSTLHSIYQSSARPKPSPRSFGSTEKIKTQMYEAPELPCPGHLLMVVSAIGEDGTIYARTQIADRQYDQLKKRFQQSMKFNPCLKKYTWKTVQGCVVHGSDTLWYRGHRLELLGGHVKVQNIDSGYVETIPVVHVQPRLLLEDIPQLCVPCQLHGISPLGGHWQRDAVALLTELLLNRWVDAHILELPADPRGSLTVDMFLDRLSVSRIMSENNHGSLDQASPSFLETSSLSSPALLDDWDIDTEGLLEEDEPLGCFIYPDLPPEGENFPVRVKHLCTPNELFLWPLEGMTDVEINGETLDEALNRVNSSIESLSRLNCFPRGGPCLARYSDSKYYRAKIMDITSVEPLSILVQHVDFGSDDTLPTSKLRQIPPELLLFPTCALKVKVAGFKAPSVNRQEDKLPYSPVWSIRAAMDMIDLLHGRISATVEAREPELTVRLYTEDGQPVHMPLVSSGLAELA